MFANQFIILISAVHSQAAHTMHSPTYIADKLLIRQAKNNTAIDCTRVYRVECARTHASRTHAAHARTITFYPDVNAASAFFVVPGLCVPNVG